jgi:hypothetical protein
MGDARRGAKSHPGHTGMRGYDFPAVVKLLEVHGAVSHHLLLGTRERDRSYAVVSVQEHFELFECGCFSTDGILLREPSFSPSQPCLQRHLFWETKNRYAAAYGTIHHSR